MMKINVHVKTKSKIEKVEELSDDEFIVWVNALPVDGKANKRVIELLAKHLKVPKSKIELSTGSKSKKKVFKLL